MTLLIGGVVLAPGLAQVLHGEPSAIAHSTKGIPGGRPGKYKKGRRIAWLASFAHADGLSQHCL